MKPTRQRKPAREQKLGRSQPLVGVVMGSDTDLPVMSEAVKTLQEFGIPFEVEVTSAHRSPQRTHEYAHTAAERGLKVIIVGAGGASHLAGVVAAETILPVIAVPVVTTPLGGLDALYSTVQMPGGIPVGVMAVDKPGARNAAIYAAEILATADGALAERLRRHKEELARSVEEKSARVKQQFESP
ncbi:MAG: 5-(carboxyamino)imidazole ribonucleotide mutase [Acidobacteria bacterium]|nr:5-(carboxyamino)imidazole ribonucleotide mutase [Acidobacteriota bacterium]